MVAWYALQVRCRSEQLAADALINRELQVFHPTYPVRRRWSDRYKTFDLPLFPGYLFCHFEPAAEKLPVLTAPGVIQIVGFGRIPVPVEPAEIEAIRRLLASGRPPQPWPFLSTGARVRIERGPLAGIEGLVVSAKGQDRLVLSVSLLQRSVAVEIERECLVPLR